MFYACRHPVDPFDFCKADSVEVRGAWSSSAIAKIYLVRSVLTGYLVFSRTVRTFRGVITMSGAGGTLSMP